MTTIGKIGLAAMMRLVENGQRNDPRDYEPRRPSGKDRDKTKAARKQSRKGRKK